MVEKNSKKIRFLERKSVGKMPVNDKKPMPGLDYLRPKAKKKSK